MRWERQEGKEMVQDRLSERAVCDKVVPSEKTSNFTGDSYYIIYILYFKAGGHRDPGGVGDQ